MNTLIGKRVLIVEDEPVIAMTLEDMLLELGCEVVGPATRVEHALQLVSSGHIDAAMLDVNLDGSPSYPVARALDQGGLPYAFASGYGVESAGQGKSVPVLHKPYRLDQVEDVLRRLFAAPG